MVGAPDMTGRRDTLLQVDAGAAPRSGMGWQRQLGEGHGCGVPLSGRRRSVAADACAGASEGGCGLSAGEDEGQCEREREREEGVDQRLMHVGRRRVRVRVIVIVSVGGRRCRRRVERLLLQPGGRGEGRGSGGAEWECKPRADSSRRMWGETCGLIGAGAGLMVPVGSSHKLRQRPATSLQQSSTGGRGQAMVWWVLCTSR
jgi:hypothetical protein